MRVGLDFLQLKHSAKIAFFGDVASPSTGNSPEARAVRRAHDQQLEHGKMHPISSWGFEDNTFLMHFVVTVEASQSPPLRGGFVVQTKANLHGLQQDLG